MINSNSSFPNLILLCLVLIGLPLLNHKAQKSQQIIINIQEDKPEKVLETPVAKHVSATAGNASLAFTSK